MNHETKNKIYQQSLFSLKNSKSWTIIMKFTKKYYLIHELIYQIMHNLPYESTTNLPKSCPNLPNHEPIYRFMINLPKFSPGKSWANLPTRSPPNSWLIYQDPTFCFVAATNKIFILRSKLTPGIVRSMHKTN